jgi:hypothetical protein
MKSLRRDSISIIGLFNIMIAPLGLLFAIVWLLSSALAMSAVFFFFSLFWLVSGLGLLHAKTMELELYHGNCNHLARGFTLLGVTSLLQDHFPSVIDLLGRSDLQAYEAASQKLLGKGIGTETSSQSVAKSNSRLENTADTD